MLGQPYTPFERTRIRQPVSLVVGYAGIGLLVRFGLMFDSCLKVPKVPTRSDAQEAHEVVDLIKAGGAKGTKAAPDGYTTDAVDSHSNTNTRCEI